MTVDPRAVDRIDLVLLGDVLDITGSQRWLAGDARPWGDVQSHAVSDTVAGVVDERRHVAVVTVFAMLQGLCAVAFFTWRPFY